VRRLLFKIALAFGAACHSGEASAPSGGAATTLDSGALGSSSGSPGCSSSGAAGGSECSPYPSTVTCSPPLASICSSALQAEWGFGGPFGPACEPTWQADECTVPGGPCSGFLAMAAGSGLDLYGGAGGLCIYDAVSLQLVSYVFLDIGSGNPSCVAGTASIPGSCVQNWTWAAGGPVGCSPHGPPAPWYCATLPGANDNGALCTSAADCNFEGGVCLFSVDSCTEPSGQCTPTGGPTGYNADCAIPHQQGTACGCDGGIVPTCDGYSLVPTTGPCDASTGEDAAADEGG
jgi:hypothetical protein